ncbi:MAG: VWA domain-containing protein [Planctomycetes bacterium]|nr:VWA domain-containing protein [Planctomycetota bacterium]
MEKQSIKQFRLTHFLKESLFSYPALILFFINAITLVPLWVISKSIESKPYKWSFNLSQSHQGSNPKLVGEWYAEKEISPFPAGRHEYHSTRQWPVHLPKLKIKGRDIAITTLSQYKKQENITQVVIYDEWNHTSKLKHPIIPADHKNQQILILLDQSATMGEEFHKNEKHTRLEKAIQSLKEKRRLSSREWQMYTFSDMLIQCGEWPHDGEKVPLGLWKKPSGTTALLSALTELAQNLSVDDSDIGKEKQSDGIRAQLQNSNLRTHKQDNNQEIATPLIPRTWVIISDGQVSERDSYSIKKVISQLKKQAIHIHILSPDLQPMDLWQPFYNQSLVNSQWPTSNNSKNIPLTNSTQKPHEKWHDLIATQGSQEHQVILFSQEGLPLIYMSSSDGNTLFHVCARPDFEQQELKSMISQLWQNNLVLTFLPEKIRIDTFSKSSSLIKIKDFRWQNLSPETPGIYIWPIPELAKLPVKLDCFHPEIGPFEVSGLNFYQHIHQARQKQQQTQWQLSQYLEPIGPYKQIILSLLLIFDILLISFILRIKSLK